MFWVTGVLRGKRQVAGSSFLFVPEKETKRARRSDAAAAGWGCGPRPQDAATLRRPSQALGGLSKENDLKWRGQQAVGKTEESNRVRYNLAGCLFQADFTGKWYQIHSLLTGPQTGEKAVVRWPHSPGPGPQPWSASTASKRWHFFASFLVTKRKDTLADCRLPRSKGPTNPTAAARHLPLHRGGLRKTAAIPFHNSRKNCGKTKPLSPYVFAPRGRDLRT